MLLIHPPLVKPCEPPPGPARIKGALDAHGIPCSVVDANIEGILDILKSTPPGHDAWTSRAVRNRSRNLDFIRDGRNPLDPARYRRAVADLNRLAAAAGQPFGARITLANYQDDALSPLSGDDLIQAAKNPEKNLFYRYFSQRLPQIVERERPERFGISLNYLGQALPAFAMIGFLKKVYPKIEVILGGGLVTSWTRRTAIAQRFHGLVDRFIDGQGEAPLLALHGVTPRKGEHYTPSYETFPQASYFMPGPVLPYSASSGCYWRRCAFCPERSEGSPYHPLAPLEVISDLQKLEAKMEPALVHLLDNAVSPELMDAMISHHGGTPWYGFARITPHLADPGFCSALRSSGCVMLQLGIESGDQGVLDALEKGIDLATASQALMKLKEAGISTYVYLLFGTPPETKDCARKTLDFIVRHSAWIDFLNTAIFNLPCGSDPGRSLETGLFYEGDLQLYEDFTHPSGWHRKSARLFVEREFKRHPAIRPIILRDPPLFTSNHAPFFSEAFRIGTGRKK